MADMILLGLAVICTAYFMIIVFYAGMGTSFAFIWLFFAALCVFLVYGKWYYRKNMDRIPRCSYYGSVLHPGVYGGSSK